MERPLTKGLAVLGGAPPTRSGGASAPTAGRLVTGTAKRTAHTSGGSGLDPAAQELIVKLRLKFGDTAATVSGQEIITREVLQYLSQPRLEKTRAVDIAGLEERIRTRLLGGTPSRSSLAASKRLQGPDDWLAIYEYDIALGEIKQKAEHEATKAQQAALRAHLEKQIAEHERLQKLEQEQEEAYWRKEQEALRRAEQEEEERQRLRTEIMLKLRDERLHQVEERVGRREAALARRRAEEALDASRTAYATAEELKQEEAARATAKLALKGFLSQNDVSKALREEAKKKQWEEDAQFVRKWEEILAKQEYDRRSTMDRIKRSQAKLQEAADRQGENRRRWLETPLVERYYKEREDTRAAEEERRATRQKEVAKQMTLAVAEQLKEREAARAKLKHDEEAYAATVAAKVKEAEEAERARKAALQEKKLKFRAEIEAQMQDAAVRRREAAAPMSEVERKLNTRTLQQVQMWRSTGSLPLPDLTATRTIVH